MPGRRRPLLVPALMTAALCACATPSPSIAPPASAGSSASPSSSASTASPTNGFPVAGRPYSADDILTAMRESRRPGGVPDEVESEAVAAAIADTIWTFDGQPWAAVSAGGSCGPDSCTVELVGTREGSEGEDLWSFDVDPGTGAVRLSEHELGAVPDEVRADLDALARSLALGGELDNLLLASVSWLSPPAAPGFALAYRSGNEEGSCALDIVLDPVARRILESRSTDC